MSNPGPAPVCPRCGKQLPAGTKFCLACGCAAVGAGDDVARRQLEIHEELRRRSAKGSFLERLTRIFRIFRR